eukprot:6177953-Pleurochrysis_carterae.AAC.2
MKRLLSIREERTDAVQPFHFLTTPSKRQQKLSSAFSSAISSAVSSAVPSHARAAACDLLRVLTK